MIVVVAGISALAIIGIIVWKTGIYQAFTGGTSE
jgi:hypothetical protein